MNATPQKRVPAKMPLPYLPFLKTISTPWASFNFKTQKFDNQLSKIFPSNFSFLKTGKHWFASAPGAFYLCVIIT
jgi:hypothetical protein